MVMKIANIYFVKELSFLMMTYFSKMELIVGEPFKN